MRDEFLPRKLKLAEETIERRPLIARLRKVGHGMEAGLKQKSFAKVIGVETAGERMLLEDQGLKAKTGSTDAGGKSGETAADYDELVISQTLICLSASVQDN